MRWDRAEAIRITRAWVSGKEGITLDDVKTAAYAAAAAADADQARKATHKNMCGLIRARIKPTALIGNEGRGKSKMEGLLG